MSILLKNLMFTIIVPGTAGVYVPLLIARNQKAVNGVWFAVAMAVLVIGASIYTWCVWDFATYGHGTPAPVDAPKRLVVRGLYRHSRNPMYLGVLTVILGWVLMYQSGSLAVYAVGMAIMFRSFVVFYEEPALQRLFGDEYAIYCRRVGRWLTIPHL